MPYGSRAFGDPPVLELVEVAAPSSGGRYRPGTGDGGLDQPKRCQERRRRHEADDAAAHPRPRLCRRGRQGPAEWIGAAVWGTGGDAGFTRDGTHAEMIAVPVASLRRKPETLSFDQAASSASITWPLGAALKPPGSKLAKPCADRRRRRCRRRGRPDRPTHSAPASSAPTGRRRIRTHRSMPCRDNDHRRRGLAGQCPRGDRQQRRGCRV